MTDMNKLRNIGILAHVDAGKTTITEFMLYKSGRIRSMGSVDKGTAHTDYMNVERERGISIRSATTSFTWRGTNINLIDTPGHVDFSAEVERCLRVLDCAVLVISAVEGIQAQTEVLWKALRTMEIPTIIFINKIDRIGSDSAHVLKEIRKQFSSYAVPLQVVTGEGTSDLEIINVLSKKDVRLEESQEILGGIIECLADKDEDILNKYINGAEITVDTMVGKLAACTCNGEVFPVLCGSAIKGVGITELMDGVVEYLPGPVGNTDLPLSAVIFGINRDVAMGRIAHIRIFNGNIRVRDTVLDLTNQSEDKVTQVRKINVQKYEDVGIAAAGDIAAICGINRGRIGDILGSTRGIPQVYHLPVPFLKVQVYPGNESEYPKLVSALQELSDEDPMLDMQWLQVEREVHIKIMGIIQMEILSTILKERFGLDASFGNASVIYKETPSCAGEGFASYTMPKPCWAVLRFTIEPGKRGSGIVYSSKVRTEDILARYQKQVEKTIQKALEQGLYGFEVTDIIITLIGGEYHVIHTCPPDFAIATPMAIMDGLANTGTTLLEPVLKFRISAPEDISGRILNDIVQMRGSFDTPVITNGLFEVEGLIPAATSLDYHIKLASMTGGKGVISTVFESYMECPIELENKCQRRGVNPLDRAKYILYARNALIGE